MDLEFSHLWIFPHLVSRAVATYEANKAVASFKVSLFIIPRENRAVASIKSSWPILMNEYYQLPLLKVLGPS